MKTLYTYTLRDCATGKTITKTQITEPRVAGYVCVDREKVRPAINSQGERLFRDANNRPYYAAVRDDGSHRQP